MIQDIAPHKLNNQYDPAKHPRKESFLLCFRQEKLCCRIDETGKNLVFPRIAEFDPIPEEDLVYLFSVDDKDCFMPVKDPADIPEGYGFLSQKEIRQAGAGPRDRVFAMVTALQLSNWYRDNVYCGTCGSHTRHSDRERALVCEKCGRVIYPRIVPAVIVGVRDGNRILVTKYAGRDIPFYALIAGFTEIGETLEETVEREVMEEVGLRVKNITYYKSQPWGMVDDLLTGFFCDLDGSDKITMDAGELKLAEWAERQDVVLQPDDYSLTNEMMMKFKNGEV